MEDNLKVGQNNVNSYLTGGGWKADFAITRIWFKLLSVFIWLLALLATIAPSKMQSTALFIKSNFSNSVLQDLRAGEIQKSGENGKGVF